MFDTVVSIGSTFIGNLQSFWIGLLILLVFAYELGWFPASGGFGYIHPGLELGVHRRRGRRTPSCRR